MTKCSIQKIVTVLKALSEPNRLRIWVALQTAELCLCHLTDMLHLAPSTVSKHTDILQKAGCITAKKQGRWTFFKAIPDHTLMLWFSDQKIELTSEIKQDAQFIRKIQSEECC